MSYQDVHFTTIANQFEQDIYGSSKGYIRWNVLWEDLLSELPQLQQGDLTILDAGGGSGRMTVALAKLGNHVTLCEPSKEMLEQARQIVTTEYLNNITFVNKSLQDFAAAYPFDVILNHAVLEWLAEPKVALEHLIKQLKPGGYLSLMFYNRNAALFKDILAGDFSLEALPEGTAKRGWNEQARPLFPETVAAWLEEFGMQLKARAGIRIFHDHLADKDKEGKLEQLLNVEKTLRRQEPFVSLAQHVHFICQKQG
jgi:S-adenosylmethionine-dependent methyltransferase